MPSVEVGGGRSRSWCASRAGLVTPGSWSTDGATPRSSSRRGRPRRRSKRCCSSTGAGSSASWRSRRALSFNWRLVLAPLPVLGYVVVHELCHLLRPDHSSAFWELVAAAWPSYPDERAWLDLHGPELLAYRVPEPEHESR